MLFSDVLHILLTEADSGPKIRRKSWIPDRFVILMPAMKLPEGMVNTRTRKYISKGPIQVGSYLVCYCGEKWQPGWTPSTEELLSDDWHCEQNRSSKP